MTVITGLDIATRTGITIMDGDRLLHCEAFRPKGDTDAEIFHGFRVHLRATLRAFDVEYGAAEQPLPTNLQADFMQKDGALAGVAKKRNPVTMATYMRIYGLYGHAAEIFYALNIPFEPVHQATWRKAFLGSGRADKDMAVAQVAQLSKQRGWPEITSKDACESLGVAWWLAGHLKIAQMARPGDLFAPKEGSAA